MFESLKKKFSRTSEKLEEELIEEAEKEDNLQEESGQRFSFFSFGRKKDKDVKEEDESNLLPESTEEEAEEEAVEEKKSHFWSRSKDESEDEEVSEDEDIEEEPEETEESDQKTSTKPINNSIMELAYNDDYSVETIAKEANRINRKEKGEIFVSLH